MKQKLLIMLLILGIGAQLMSQNLTTQSLNGQWQFIYDKKNAGVNEEYYNIKFDKDQWQTVTVPSFWSDAEYNGIGWYSKIFQPNPTLNNKKVALFFESVDDEAVVYLNGKKIIEHSGYGVRFNKDITEELIFDQNNVLTIKINDTGGAGGLCGDVYLREFKNNEDLLKSAYFSRESTPLPNWVENALIYELYVRAHSEEGKFTNVTEDISRLKKLGVDCIWLMPIFPIGEEKKKGKLGSPYAIKEFKKVNPEYGTMEEFKTLVQTAHDHDIKVILDIACNHSAWDNWLIEKHPDFYTRNEDDEIIYPPGTDWTDVADFNYENEELRNYMLSVLEFWVKNLDVDGYRADVAELVPDDFWKKAYQRLRAIKPNVFMLAEGAHPRLHVNGFHMTYAWNLRMTIAKILRGDKAPEFLAEVLKRDYYRYPKNAMHMVFTENHDKKRSTQFFGEDQHLLSAVLTLSLPGVPMIYGGQEVGAAQKPSLFFQQPVNWDFDNQYYEFYQEYFQIRQTNPAFSKGEFQLVDTDHPQKVLAYLRKFESNTVLIIGNTTDEQVPVKIGLDSDIVQTLMGETANIKEGILKLVLPENGFSIIQIK